MPNALHEEIPFHRFDMEKKKENKGGKERKESGVLFVQHPFSKSMLISGFHVVSYPLAILPSAINL